MEPSEFDQLIKDKLVQENDLHSYEIEKSKPFVWTAVQNKLGKTRVLIPWYYAAAAVILLFIFSSFLFFNMQNQHSNEIKMLSHKVEILQNTYAMQSNMVLLKDQELSSLCNEIDRLELSVQQLDKDHKTTNPQTQLVYQTDTVFIKQVQYITQIVPSIENKPKAEIQLSNSYNKLVNQTGNDNVIYNTIYPSFDEPIEEKTQGENDFIKLKLASFNSN